MDMMKLTPLTPLTHKCKPTGHFNLSKPQFCKTCILRLQRVESQRARNWEGTELIIFLCTSFAGGHRVMGGHGGSEGSGGGGHGGG